jgi:MoaA/NifB/PqqE/SkfB family radical SAM enzyme
MTQPSFQLLDHRALDPEIGAELLRARGLDGKDLAKEAAVKHARHWVRLTRLCNQRCIFCLDAWNQNGTYVDTAQLEEYIALGHRLGRERLILSGGEPTIHPDYIRLIRHGRRVGYDWIQTVTNGMLFAYPEFARRAVQAGLDEVTMSIHGHTAKIQDGLVGVPGAFDKAIAGLRNLQALGRGRVVINIDIVINRQNVEHLRDTIDFFRGLGIHEFDLLYIMPFGRGFSEYRRQLFFDLAEHAEDIRRAIEVSKEPGVYIWTNRLPPEYLEGYESLIQDPHKLHSEVQGGLHNFEGFLKLGVPPDCYGERCDHCFMKGLCHDTMFEYKARLMDGRFDRVRVDLSAPGPRSVVAARVLALQRPSVVHVRAPDAEALRTWLHDHPWRDSEATVVHGELAGASALELVDDPALERLLISDAEVVASVLGQPPPSVGPRVVVRLDAATAAWLLGHPAAVAPWVEADRLLGELSNFEYMSEVAGNGMTPEVLMALAGLGLRLVNVPRCLGGERALPGSHYELSAEMLDEQGNLQVSPYVHRYVVGEYYKKSLRCRGCPADAQCRGMHINYLRTFGFRALDPARVTPAILRAATAGA